MLILKRLWLYVCLRLTMGMPYKLAWTLAKFQYPTKEEQAKEITRVNNVLKEQGYNAELVMKD